MGDCDWCRGSYYKLWSVELLRGIRYSIIGMFFTFWCVDCERFSHRMHTSVSVCRDDVRKTGLIFSFRLKCFHRHLGLRWGIAINHRVLRFNTFSPDYFLLSWCKHCRRCLHLSLSVMAWADEVWLQISLYLSFRCKGCKRHLHHC